MNTYEIGRNVVNGESDLINEWAENVLLPKLKDADHLFKTLKAHSDSYQRPFNTQFITKDALSKNEVLELVYFYSSNFMMAPGLLPTEDLKENNVHFNQQFISANSDRRYDERLWTNFLNNYGYSVAEDQTLKFVDFLEQPFIQDLGPEQFQQFFDSLPIFYEQPSRNLVQLKDGIQKQIGSYLAPLKLFSPIKSARYTDINPLIGPKAGCGLVNRNRLQKINCPLYVDDFDQFYPKFKQYLKNLKVAYLCPLFPDNNLSILNQEESYALFTRMGLNLAGFDSREICNLPKLNQLENQTFPKNYSKAIIQDILAIGKNPKIKPELRMLTERIKYYKDINNQLLNKDQMARNFVQANAIFSEKLTHNALKLTSDHKGHFYSFPGLVNQVFNYLRFVGQEDNNLVFNELLKRYGPGLKVSDIQTYKGDLYQFLKNDVIKTAYAQSLSNDEDLLSFGLRIIFPLIESPEKLKMLVYLLSRPQDIETIQMMEDSIPLFIQSIKLKSASDRIADFSWEKENPYMPFVKYLLRVETMRPIQNLVAKFSIEEILKGQQHLLEGMGFLGRTIDEKIKYSKIFAQEVTNYLMRSNLNTINISSIQQNLDTLLYFPYSTQNLEDTNQLIDQLIRPKQSLSGRPVSSTLDQIKALIQIGLTQGLELIERYQNLYTYSKQDSNFKQMINGILLPIGSANGEQLLPLFEFLSDERVGVDQGVFLKLLNDTNNLQLIQRIFTNMSKVSLESWKVFNQELVTVLNELNTLLEFADERLKWSQNDTLEYQNSFKVLTRLSRPSNLILQRQQELIDEWLNKAIEKKTQSQYFK